MLQKIFEKFDLIFFQLIVAIKFTFEKRFKLLKILIIGMHQ